jgi:hypothetical protein
MRDCGLFKLKFTLSIVSSLWAGHFSTKFIIRSLAGPFYSHAIISLRLNSFWHIGSSDSRLSTQTLFYVICDLYKLNTELYDVCVTVLILYSGVARFESLPGFRLFWLRFSSVPPEKYGDGTSVSIHVFNFFIRFQNFPHKRMLFDS